jgi:hypothetical protein
MKKVLTIILMLLSVGTKAQWHVTTQGKTNNDGTINSPWSLEYALSSSSPVKGGDIVYIHGGTYAGTYEATISGYSDSYIVVTNYNGENVIIEAPDDGNDATAALRIKDICNYVEFRGLSFTTAGPRYSNQAGSFPTDIDRREGLMVEGHHTRIIDCIIYDCTGNGIGFWSPAYDSEIIDCIIFNNGWQGPDKGHGHGIYAQNEIGTKTIKGCLIFNQMTNGLDAYTEGGSLKGFNIINNVAFNNGAINEGGEIQRNLFIGSGSQPIERVLFENNKCYSSSVYSKGNFQIGYGAINEDAIVRGNYVVDGGPAFHAKKWKNLSVTDNTFISSTHLAWYDPITDGVTSSVINWNNNIYHGHAGNSMGESSSINRMPFDSWKLNYGFDTNSVYNIGDPVINIIFIDSHTYANRKTVTIYNWEGLESVPINVAYDGLSSTDSIFVYDAENLLGGPVLEQEYGNGDLYIPMNLTEVQQPNSITRPVPHTGKFFGVYIFSSQRFLERSSSN